MSAGAPTIRFDFMSKAAMSVWAGRVISILAIAFLALDGVMKLIQPKVVIDATAGIGWPADRQTLATLGIVLLVSTVLYAFPRTSVFGAILLTGYLGGAVASHVRHEDPLFTHDVFGLYLGVLVWGGLWLRDARTRALLPLTRISHHFS